MATKVPKATKVLMATKVPTATKVPMATKSTIATKSTNRTKFNPRGLASFEIWACYDLKAYFWWPNKRLFSYIQRWNTLYEEIRYLSRRNLNRVRVLGALRQCRLTFASIWGEKIRYRITKHCLSGILKWEHSNKRYVILF